MLVDCPGCDKCECNDGYVLHMSAGRPTKAHEYIFLLTKNPTYFFDQEAVRAPSGHNIRSVWTIPTEPTPEAHFSTFPQALVTPCNLAGTSAKGCCPTCGAPWARVVDVSYEEAGAGNNNMARKGAPFEGTGAARPYETRMLRHSQTLGWRPTCACAAGDPVPCTVLDPFLGSGTVGRVAESLGRRWVGCDLSYHDLAKARVQVTRGLPL